MKRQPYELANVQDGGAVFWKSLEEKKSIDGLQAFKEAEFPLGITPTEQRAATEPHDLGHAHGGSREALTEIADGELPKGIAAQVSRRGFVKVGAAMTAVLGLDGCVRRPVEKIAPYTRSPEYTVPGIPSHYATVLNQRGEALGLLVESHEGRPTKVEGNPDHPSSKGAADLTAQASILDLYDPDRSTSPTHGGKPVKYDEFEKAFELLMDATEGDAGARMRVLATPTNSPTFVRLRDQVRQRFSQVRFHTWSSVSDSNAREGARLAFGQPMHANYDYARARVIVSLDSDFLQTEPGAVRAMRAFADGRRLREPTDPMSRFYMVESTHSTTGANADHRLRVASRDVERYARLLAKELAAQGLDLGPVRGALGDASAAGIPDHWVKSVAKEILANRGRALIVTGSRQPARLHALVHALNAALGNVGQVVTYTPVVDGGEQDHAADLRQLALDMDAGKVDTLVVLGGNPMYDAPADVKFGDRLSKVKTSIHLSSRVDETSKACTWHVPLAHPFEAWGDQRSLDGTWSIQQPLIQPLHDGSKSELELLSLMIGGMMETGDKPRSGYDSVRDTLRQVSRATLGFEKQWSTALARGLLSGSAPFAFTPSDVKGADIAAELAKAPAPGKPLGAGNYEVVFAADSKMLDGRHANNPWLCELPDPMTKIVWDNAAYLSPKTAKDLGVASGDRIELAREGASVVIAAWVLPGHADESITVSLGWGRTDAGRYGNGRGFDVNRLRSIDALHFTDGVSVRNTGATYELTQTQDHHSMEGRPVAIDATLDEYKATPNFAQFRSPSPRTLPLWNRRDYSQGHRWGMNIDLSACTGCNACVVACQAENNIATVGKTQVGRGREMLWLRVDRYFIGTDEADPKVAMQPLACVQCEEAPCENVCPVNATAHSPEGLNDMAYNRCIGTRYCANNCPYKVRRFNYLEFQGGEQIGGGPEALYGELPEVRKMQFNPNVTVRMRGVMEKCTYCVQRIQEGKIASKRSGQPVRDGDITPACAQTCPANAITFGDLNDPTARVTQAAKRDRTYELLSEIGTHPRTTYLGKIRNPNTSPEWTTKEKG